MKTRMKYLARSGVAWWILVLGCGLVVNISSAAESKDDDNHNPTGCRNVGYNFSLKVLHLYPGEVGARQSLYFIFNQLHEPINLYQLRDNEKLRNLYLNHSIAPQQWSVFATGEKELKFTCTINARGSNYGDIVDCADSIRVCEYNHVIFGLNNRGNYWLINSYTRNAAVNAVVHYGIIPAQ